MKLIRHLLFIVAMFSTTQTFAQHDILFTQYNMSPMTLNPAMAGSYEGSYRVGGIYRSQWNAASSTFQTPSFFVDAPILMIKKRHWVGVGAHFLADKAGAAGQEQKHIALTGAFHYALDKKYKNVVSFGLQANSETFGHDQSAVNDGNFNAISKSAMGNKSIPVQNARFFKLVAGVYLKSKLDKKSDIALGLSARNLNTPNISVLTTSGTRKISKLPVLIALHADYNRMLSKKLSIHPSLLFRTITASKELNANAMVGYRLDKKRPDMVLKAGLGTRLTQDNPSLNLLLGADYKNFRFGLAYDLATGTIASAVNNTLELSLHYTGKIYKDPEVKGVHFCPKY